MVLSICHHMSKTNISVFFFVFFFNTYLFNVNSKKKQSLPIVGNSSSSKTATTGNCALWLKASGYNIIPITSVKDIRKDLQYIGV